MIYIVMVLTLPYRVAKAHQMKHLKLVDFNNPDLKCIYPSNPKHNELESEEGGA